MYNIQKVRVLSNLSFQCRKLSELETLSCWMRQDTNMMTLLRLQRIQGAPIRRKTHIMDDCAFQFQKIELTRQNTRRKPTTPPHPNHARQHWPHQRRQHAVLARLSPTLCNSQSLHTQNGPPPQGTSQGTFQVIVIPRPRRLCRTRRPKRARTDTRCMSGSSQKRNPSLADNEGQRRLKRMRQ